MVEPLGALATIDAKSVPGLTVWPQAAGGGTGGGGVGAGEGSGEGAGLAATGSLPEPPQAESAMTVAAADISRAMCARPCVRVVLCMGGALGVRKIVPMPCSRWRRFAAILGRHGQALVRKSYCW